MYVLPSIEVIDPKPACGVCHTPCQRDFVAVQPHIESGRASLAVLTDVSIIQQKRQELWPAPDLTRLTALRTLSLGGCYHLCATAESLSPLTCLTALSLGGSEADPDLVREFGGYLLAFSGLQRLDVELEYHWSRVGHAGRLDSSEEEEDSEEEEEEDDSAEEEESAEEENRRGAKCAALGGEFWAGVRGALRELPLALGAYVYFKSVDISGRGCGGVVLP